MVSVVEPEWRNPFPRSENYMNILLIGPQGSGKGTQAEKLIEKFGFAYVNMGGIFRSLKDKNTSLAKRATEFVEKGILVSDDIVIELINECLGSINRLDGIIFDGFPRVVSQAEYFDKFLTEKNQKINVVIYLTLTREETLKRLSGRRTCSVCGKVFNVLTNPPKKEGFCNDCGGSLIVRTDETPQAIETRLNQFLEKTHPLIEYYNTKGIVEEIDGNRPIETIFADIVERLKKRGLIENG